ncbi:hypothetical protein PENSTE_c013G09992 [Penicillium steckii]|uniref:RRM domain-containing protein n=1 Tax=Penicillium steckii TaxID=303698 RepID=A0A1V6T1T2_9EURO|nr:hypothetical protein PENSTE_c013G09992 [Penicillium steckii]
MSRKLAPEANRYVLWNLLPLLTLGLRAIPQKPGGPFAPLKFFYLQFRNADANILFSSDRILFVKNLNYNVTAEQLFDLFGKFGPIRQIRQGIANNSKGTAFVVYEDVHDAKQACDKLNGFNFQNRYLVAGEDGSFKGGFGGKTRESRKT